MKSKKLNYVFSVLLPLTSIIANQPTGAKSTLLEATKKGDLNQFKSQLEGLENIDITDEDGRTALYYAVVYGRRDILEMLFAKHADVNIKDKYGISPISLLIDILSTKAQNKYVEILKLLVANGANVREKGHFGMTALHWASIAAHKDIAELLIAKGAEINAKDTNGKTPLHMACSDGNLDMAKLLIAKGADINAQDERIRHTPLHTAAFLGHKDIVKLLVANGANIAVKDYSGSTPMHDAAWEGHIKIVEFLVANGADIHSLNKDKETPLHRAAQYSQKDTVEFLISKGADVNAKNRYGATPLGLAIGGYRRTRELPKVLYSEDYCKRGDYFYRQDEFDRAIEDYSSAIRLDPKNDQAYYRRGMAWAKVDNPKKTIADWKKAIELDWGIALDVYYAKRLLKSSDTELDLLLRNTAMKHLEDLEVVSGYAVGYAASPGYFYTISLIISEPLEEKIFLHMAQSNNPVTRAMAMICLAREDKLKYERQLRSFYTDTAEVEYMPAGCGISRITLDKLAKNIIEDPNTLDCWSASHTNWISSRSKRDSQREDALERQVEVIRVLISESADIHATDRFGETPLHFAAEHGNTYVAEFLITNGADINAKNNNGETPLHCATFWGYEQMVELLMASGADITVKNSKGQTAMDIATEQDYQGLRALLQGFQLIQ